MHHLQFQSSIRFLSGGFGFGESITDDHTDSTGRSGARNSESSTKSFTYSMESMEPPATNPVTFHKLLSYNSTWALIDRDSFQGYIPVWELIKDLGGDFEDGRLLSWAFEHVCYTKGSFTYRKIQVIRPPCLSAPPPRL